RAIPRGTGCAWRYVMPARPGCSALSPHQDRRATLPANAVAPTSSARPACHEPGCRPLRRSLRPRPDDAHRRLFPSVTAPYVGGFVYLAIMTLNEITRSAVLQAVAEDDRLGRDAFLERYGFEPPPSYLLGSDGKEYDSKAIVGAAHGYLPGRDPLGRDEFSGGKDHAANLLSDLGFDVVVRTAG